MDQIFAEIIFEQLDYKSIPNATFVCSKWYNIIKSKPDLQYKMKYFIEFGSDDNTSHEANNSNLTWQEIYENRAASENIKGDA